MRALIIWARIRDEWPCVHNDMHKHLATDGSISVTNFICFRPFCPSYCNEPTMVIVLHTVLVSVYISSYVYISGFMHAYSLYIRGQRTQIVWSRIITH
jgi:hypothetical protein